MKKSNYIIILGLLICFIASCGIYKEPISVERSNNTDYNVSYLFEHDGCKVYRFIDNGNYVYFTSCRGNVTAIIENDSIEKRVNTITYVE